MDPTEPLLLGADGCGNAIVEMAFALARVPVRTEAIDYSAGSPTRGRLLAVNPLGQVPALVLPDGGVMTESLAMIHWIDDRAPAAGLVPRAGDPGRAAFLRWSTFIVSALYPTWTYGDEPAKWVPHAQGAKQLRESTDRHRIELWRQVEAAAGAPWFLGTRASAIDLYLAAMTRWRPGRGWFEANAPRVLAIAERAAALPAVAPVFARHFG